MTNAQLSFHGYRDAVKFFVALPGQAPSVSAHDDESISESMTIQSTKSVSPSFGDILVVSGGDGYVDLRVENTITNDNQDDTTNTKTHASHLIIWHMGSA